MTNNCIIRESSKGYDVLPIDALTFSENRIIYFTGEVNESSSADLVSKLMFLDSESDHPITLLISSGGGSVIHGWAVIDTIMSLKSPVITVNTCLAGSMAGLLFLAGSKRLIMPHARTLVHSVATEGLAASRLTPRALKDEIGFLTELSDELNGFIHERTGLPLKEIEKMCEKDTWLTADEAIKYGFAHHKITSLADLDIKNYNNI